MVNNEILFYADGDFTKIANKVHVDKISAYGLSSTGSFATFVPGQFTNRLSIRFVAFFKFIICCFWIRMTACAMIIFSGSKGQPCFVRVYQYPNLTAALAQRSFYKAENVEFKWNVKGTCVLAVAQTEVDDTGTSYYGQTMLHFLNVNGDTQTIQLAKKGPGTASCQRLRRSFPRSANPSSSLRPARETQSTSTISATVSSHSEATVLVLTFDHG